MDPNEVQLIGVGPTVDEPEFDPFMYSVDAPTNLWIGYRCENGSAMGFQFMQYGLNSLILNDLFNENDAYPVKSNTGQILTFTVGKEVPKEQVEAFGANTDTVRIVSVSVADPEEEISEREPKQL